MWNFQVLLLHFYVCIYFSYIGMSKVETPSPHSSRKQKKCGSCHTFLTDLDPHPDCSKCVPRGCSKESPCSHCAPLSLDAWKKWERQQCSKRSSSSMKGPKRDSAKGGNKSGHSPEQPGLRGKSSNSGAGLYPKGYSCPTPRGLAKSPWTRPLTGSFQGASPQLWSNVLLQLWNRTSVRSVGSLDRVPWTLSFHCNSCGQM